MLGRMVLTVTSASARGALPFPIKILRSAHGRWSVKTVSRGAFLRMTVIFRTQFYDSV
jgi:hypothetical protein